MSRRTKRKKSKSVVSKNSPCPCGSGKKYKHCHGDDNRSFKIKSQNDPELIDSHMTSPDGLNWTKRPGRIIAMISGVKPEDSDASIEELFGEYTRSAKERGEHRFANKLSDCRHKQYAVKYHLLSLKEEIKIRVEEFEKEYSAGSGVYFEMQNPRLIFETEFFLFQVKSSLDILVKALGTIIPPLKSMRSFAKKKIDSKEHAGGKVIVALINNGFEDLGNIFESHRQEWIQELVSMRDTITHYSQLKGFHCFIEEPYKGGREVTIHYPTMPSGRRVDEYCEYISVRLLDLYKTVLAMVLVDYD